MEHNLDLHRLSLSGTDRQTDRAKTTNSDEISALWRTHLSSFYYLSQSVVNGRKWHKVSKPAREVRSRLEVMLDPHMLFP